MPSCRTDNSSGRQGQSESSESWLSFSNTGSSAIDDGASNSKPVIQKRVLHTATKSSKQLVMKAKDRRAQDGNTPTSDTQKVLEEAHHQWMRPVHATLTSICKGCCLNMISTAIHVHFHVFIDRVAAGIWLQASILVVNGGIHLHVIAHSKKAIQSSLDVFRVSHNCKATLSSM